jgi:hypothetical protein
MHTGVEGGDSGNLNTVPAFYASLSGCSTFPSRRTLFFWLVQLGQAKRRSATGGPASEERAQSCLTLHLNPSYSIAKFGCCAVSAQK